MYAPLDENAEGDVSPLLFVVFNLALLTLGGMITFAVSANETIDIPAAGLVGVFATLAAIQLARRYLKEKGFGLLAATASSMVMLVNYGLFTLILARNPILNGPVVFLATSLAALLPGGIAYRRAVGKLGRDL